ncbi:hypothetical protein GQ457_08G028380 [Hibiscus cannabinus]
MGCLCSVFDVKKQGKPIREVRTRNWKLREGENRLSGLLEGISMRLFIGVGSSGLTPVFPVLGYDMERPRGGGRRGGRRGGRAPVHLDEIEMEPDNEEILPPPPPGEITWGFFQSAFRKKYLGTRYGDEKKREFMALVQGSMSVTDYEIQFVRLSQYAPKLVPTERE